MSKRILYWVHLPLIAFLMLNLGCQGSKPASKKNADKSKPETKIKKREKIAIDNDPKPIKISSESTVPTGPDIQLKLVDPETEFHLLKVEIEAKQSGAEFQKTPEQTAKFLQSAVSVNLGYWYSQESGRGASGFKSVVSAMSCRHVEDDVFLFRINRKELEPTKKLMKKLIEQMAFELQGFRGIPVEKLPDYLKILEDRYDVLVREMEMQVEVASINKRMSDVQKSNKSPEEKSQAINLIAREQTKLGAKGIKLTNDLNAVNQAFHEFREMNRAKGPEFEHQVLESTIDLND